jgi:hypothetical protein
VAMNFAAGFRHNGMNIINLASTADRLGVL